MYICQETKHNWMLCELTGGWCSPPSNRQKDPLKCAKMIIIYLIDRVMTDVITHSVSLCTFISCKSRSHDRCTVLLHRARNICHLSHTKQMSEFPQITHSC